MGITIQVHPDSFKTVNYPDGAGGPFVTVEVWEEGARTSLFLHTAARCDELIAAACEAKRLLTPCPAISDAATACTGREKHPLPHRDANGYEWDEPDDSHPSRWIPRETDAAQTPAPGMTLEAGPERRRPRLHATQDGATGDCSARNAIPRAAGAAQTRGAQPSECRSALSCDCGAQLPWPAKGEEVTCLCGNAWEHDGIDIGGGARLKHSRWDEPNAAQASEGAAVVFAFGSEADAAAAVGEQAAP